MIPLTEVEPVSLRPSRQIFIRLALFALLLLVGFSLLVWAGVDWKLWPERLTHLHPVIFLVAMSLLPVVGFPISAFYFFAGVVYGWALGIPLCLLALSINMSLSYLFARTLLRIPLAELVRRRGYELPSVKTPRNQFRVTFLIRTVPGPPYPFQNYLLALANIPFQIYLPVSLACQGFIGSMIVLSLSLLTLHLEPWVVIIGALILFLVAGLLGSAFYSRRERRASSSIEQPQA